MALVPVTASVGVDAPESTTLLMEVGVIAPSVRLIAGVVVALATEPETPALFTTDTEVTVPLPPDGAAHEPSARRKLVVPPPDNGASPFSVELNVSRSAVACVPVRSSGDPVPAVVRPLIVAVETFDNLELVTTPLAIVVAKDPVPLPVTSDVRVMV